MSLLAAAFLTGDVWTWDVTLRYDAPAEDVHIAERERWTVHIRPKATFTAERIDAGTLIDGGTLIPAAEGDPEIVKGTIERDGTLTLKKPWSDPDAAKALARLLNPAKTLKDRVSGWPVVRRAKLEDPKAFVPGSNVAATFTANANLVSARLGGQKLEVSP